ncbi:MAG: hypothetical protein FJ286_09430 [Planctomycetes bacterium]|nr:hypothetical protein [Planctomycetota bacterium]
MSTPAPVDAAAIQALVAEVIRRIAAGQGTPATPSVSPATSRSPTAVSSRHPIAERVVTLASIERIPDGVREVAAVATAVITPSAADRARERGITIVRGAASANAAAAARPFLIAQAAGGSHASARAAAIARALPGAQQLPTSGLADVIKALAGHASRDAARGILLTGKPTVAVVLANRSASLRAVTARDAAALAAAAADAAANLIVVDPATCPGGSLERLCADFHRSPSAPVPPELAVAPLGCGCTTHPH